MKAENEGTHLKIECSPNLLLTHSPDQVQKMMDDIAECLSAEHYDYQAVAAHLALDYQGYDLPDNFMENLLSRSSYRVQRDGIATAEFGLSDLAVTYGGGQSYTVGSANALQMANYDKTKQAKTVDKTDFFKAAWSGAFAMRCYADLAQHLGGLWLYAMRQFVFKTGRCVHPLWAMLRDDAAFSAKFTDGYYVRVRKAPGVDNSKKCRPRPRHSIAARNGTKTRDLYRFLLDINPIRNDLRQYIRQQGVDLVDFYQWLDKAIIKRRLLGAAL